MDMSESTQEMLAEQVRRIADELSAGTDADWAKEWHESHCTTWVPWEDQDATEERETLEEHLDWCDERPSAIDYLEDVLDIEYTVSSQREYLGARVLVGFGGPNIWIDTRHNRVEGYWWFEEYHTSYTDALGLDETLEEYFRLG